MICAETAQRGVFTGSSRSRCSLCSNPATNCGGCRWATATPTRRALMF